jgi:hypothetical protein
MSVEIGAVNINLRLSLAQFKQDTKDGAAAAGDAAKQIASDMDSNMTEARGSLMLLSEEVGVHLPRHLTSLIAQIPGLSTAFATMLPVMGVIAAVTVVDKLIEKHKQLQAALAQGWDSGNRAVEIHNDELQVSIDKYKELIAKLQGVPYDGTLAALHLAKEAADKLADSLMQDTNRLEKLFADAAHGDIMTAILGTSGSGQAADVAKGFQDAIAKIPHDSHFSENMEAALKDAWSRSQSEIQKNNATAAKQAADALDAGKLGNQDFVMPTTDFTEANTALQKFQTSLSATYQTLKEMKEEGAVKQEYFDDEAAAKWHTVMDNCYKAVAKSRTDLSKELATSDKEDERASEDRLTIELKSEEEANSEKLAIIKKELKEETELINEAARHEQEDIKLSHAGEMQQADAQLKLHQITEEKLLEMRRQFLDEEYQADREALEKKLALYQNDPDKDVAACQTLQDRILELDKSHANQVAAIDQQSALDNQKQWNAVFESMNSGFTGTIDGMLQGTQTMQKGFDNMYRNILLGFSKMIEQMIMQWTQSQLMGIFTQGFSVPGMSASSMPLGGALPAGLPSSVFFADGGHMDAGQTGIVGDAGPEVWKPDTAGSIVPFDKLTKGAKGGDTNHNTLININGVTDFDSFKQNESQVAAQMYAAMSAAARRKG